MKIAVNTRFLIKNKLEGIGWFTYEIIRRVVKAHPEHEFYFLFDRPFPEEFIFASNVKGIVVNPPARHPMLWYWWFEKSIPKILKKINPDIFISTDGFLSLKTPVKTILTIHDLAFEHFPEQIPKSARKFYLKNTPKYARKADLIITVSEFSKKDITEKYQIDPSKIVVIHNGAGSQFKPLSEEEKDAVKSRYSVGQDYFLFVSAIQPRKNLVRLLEAFDIFKAKFPGKQKLLVAGKHTWIKEEIESAVNKMTHKEDVIFLGHLSRQELIKVMGAATALTYVSLFEGFGIPIVDAMNAEVPVITSGVSSMPEVAGDAALLVDPYSIQSIADALIKIYSDPGLHISLVKNGRLQRQKFNWDRSAEAFWQCIEKVV